MAVRYRNALDCVRHLIRDEGGVRALYRGVGVGCIRTVCEHLLTSTRTILMVPACLRLDCPRYLVRPSSL